MNKPTYYDGMRDGMYLAANDFADAMVELTLNIEKGILVQGDIKRSIIYVRDMILKRASLAVELGGQDATPKA